jgi:holo-[acyl-carrier protein] synthase
MPFQVGIDLASVTSVRESLAAHAEFYLERIYTPREIADCRTEQGIDAESLAGRFAAKEATIKVLRPADEPVPWQSIGVVRGPSGAVDLELTGEAATLAARVGITSLAVSISHEHDYACAVVVAELG